MSGDLKFGFLDQAKYIYLRELSEPLDNSLKVVVQEAIVNPATPAPHFPELPELEEILTGSAPIESTDGCRTFELYWKHYAAYLVTEECVGSCGKYEDEDFSGRLFRVYSRSHFLEHLSRDTGAHRDPLLHFKIICLNHLIDVAAYAEPEIKQLGPIAGSNKLLQ